MGNSDANNHAAVKDIYNEMCWSSLTHAEKGKDGP
jgi:hypothetical protein